MGLIVEALHAAFAEQSLLNAPDHGATPDESAFIVEEPGRFRASHTGCPLQHQPRFEQV
ncbi:MAG: hypothetical protein ABJF67_17895 [Aurantimonas coralicida]